VASGQERGRQTLNKQSDQQQELGTVSSNPVMSVRTDNQTTITWHDGVASSPTQSYSYKIHHTSQHHVTDKAAIESHL
jgi:hypothetical protein